jgi:hypothetical protein
VRTLSDLTGREAGEPGSVGERILEVRRRDQLGVRLAVHLDELTEEELDALGVNELPDVAGGLRVVSCHLPSPPR